MTQTLQISHLIKYYGTGSVVTKALDDISFSIQKGEFTAIMGASGSGKSTLLNMISTVDRVSSGTIFLDGRNITEMKERELASFRRDLDLSFRNTIFLTLLLFGKILFFP